MTSRATERIDDALSELNSAMKERRQEVMNALNEKYVDLKSAIVEEGREVQENAMQTAYRVDSNVHRHPWRYLGGAALAGLVVGMIAGSGRSKRHEMHAA